MSELHWTEVDGVPTIWTDGPPPFRTGLLFRTGRIDETAATAGHTHLIEHLALSSLCDPTQPCNGFVGPASTGFFTMGKSEDVVAFLSGVCNALASLPGDRLEAEKKILRAENAARQFDLSADLLMWRYGAAGYGLIALDELGIARATLPQLQDCVAQRFTRENAVLWLSGPPPADLCLSLPQGTKQPLPPLSLTQETLPCWYANDAWSGVAAGSTVPRTIAVPAFLAIAAKRLREQLRVNRALSYAPSVLYDPLTTDIAHLVLYADADEQHRQELVTAFGEVFVELGQVEESELEAVKIQILEGWTGALAPPPADRGILEVQRAAMDWVLGRDFESMESNATELLSVTADDVSACFAEVESTAMFALPSGATPQSCFGERAVASTSSIVQGDVVRGVDAPIRRERLLYGPDGVSVLFPDNSHCTVRYSDLVAALYYDDGGVCLIGVDAVTVTVEPTLWRGGRSICEQIRERVPAHLVVDERSRAAETIPRPTTTAWQRLLARLSEL